MISNCGHDENGRCAGGAAGDQTGGEWAVINWYNRPWSCVLRHPDAAVRKLLAEIARKAANNNLVGYDQNQRGTYWAHLKASNFDPAQITIKCEADCSSGVAANVKAAGYRLGIQALKNVSSECYTGNLRAALKNAGFTCLTESKYRGNDAYLLEGDILLYDGHHVATNLTNGSKSGAGTTPSVPNTPDTGSASTGKTVSTGRKGMTVTASELNVRETPGGNVVGVLKNGNRIAICRKSGLGASAWFGYKDGDSILWVSGRYLEGWVLEDGKWWYCNAGYTYKKNAWQLIDGAWYYFDANGWMVTGWIQYKGDWYYLTQSGAMAAGAYIKSADKDLYYWVSAGNANNGDDQPEGVWEPQWNTANPNLSKYRVVK